MEGAGPEAFLRAGAGEARGFWARGRRWLAHRGVLATVDAGGDDGPWRFARVREEARALAGSARTGQDDDDPGVASSLRFYGGFAFRDVPEVDPFWDAFPPALFVLPRLELEGDGARGAQLRVRSTVPPGQDAGVVRARIAAELKTLASVLWKGRGAGRAGPASGAPARSPGGARASGPTLPGSPSGTDRRAWEASVGRALEGMAAGRLSKVVLARTLDLAPGQGVDPVAVVHALWTQNRGTHAFLFEPSPGQLLVGAAPETVATLAGGAFHATAVAGSVAVGESEDERGALAARLLDSAKDREEHRIVVDDMVRRLEPLVGPVRVDGRPHVLSLARIQHLETLVRARVDAGTHVLDLLAALHPTAAVCGMPRDAALDFLREAEPFERGWYAGPVGWFDAEGRGAFAPALRCAVAGPGGWRLFAGAGIVAGSRPTLEWEEAGLKFEPVLRALEASGVRVGA